MTQFVKTIGATGRIVGGHGKRDPEGFDGVPELRPMPHDGFVYYAWQGRLELGAQPSPTHEYLWIDGAPRWVDLATLADAQAVAWEAVKRAREDAEAGVFTFEGGLYDLNKENVSGAALAALMAQLAGQPFSIEWTLADNSVRVLDASTMQSLGRAMVTHIDGLHCTARGLRERIAAAATPEEAYAVTWPTE